MILFGRFDKLKHAKNIPAMIYPHVIQAIHTLRVHGDLQRKMQHISPYKLIPDSTQGENYQKRGVHNLVIVKDPLNLKYETQRGIPVFGGGIQ